MKKIAVFCLVALLAVGVLAGCGGDAQPGEPENTGAAKAPTGQLENVYEAVIGEIYGEEDPGMTRMEDAAYIEQTYGLTADMMKEYIIAVPMMNVKVDTFVGVEANEGKAAEAS